jgi:hypothetical protein
MGFGSLWLPCQLWRRWRKVTKLVTAERHCSKLTSKKTMGRMLSDVTAWHTAR